MASLPQIRRFSREDYPEAEAWFERFISTLNQFTESVYYALDRQLTFQENFRAQIRTQEFRTPSTYPTAFTAVRFSVGATTVVQGVVLLALRELPNAEPITSAVSIDWQLVNGVVSIRHVAGLTADTDYQLSILIL